MPRDRALGLILIAVGTLVVASGSALVELFGDSNFLFVAMAPGVAIIMLGYLQANRAGRPATVAPAVPVAARPGGRRACRDRPAGRGHGRCRAGQHRDGGAARAARRERAARSVDRDQRPRPGG